MKKSSLKIGFVNGCFDVLHVGHIRLLKFAKSKCDKLIVGIDSDTRVQQLKGSDRPFNSQALRREILLELKSVDKVEIFDSEQELEDLINHHNPDIMVVGSDYRDKKVVGSAYAKKLVFFERIPGHSSSKIFEHNSHR